MFARNTTGRESTSGFCYDSVATRGEPVGAGGRSRIDRFGSESIDHAVKIIVETQHGVDIVVFDHRDGHRVGEAELLIRVPFVHVHSVLEQPT